MWHYIVVNAFFALFPETWKPIYFIIGSMVVVAITILFEGWLVRRKHKRTENEADRPDQSDPQ